MVKIQMSAFTSLSNSSGLSHYGTFVGKCNKKGTIFLKREMMLTRGPTVPGWGLGRSVLLYKSISAFYAFVSHEVLCTSESLHRHSTNHLPQAFISWILCELVSG